MQTRRIVTGLAVLSTIAATIVTVGARVARADDAFELTSGSGELTLVVKGHWHVNADYPWKASVADKVFDRSKFEFTETSAKISGLPSGTVHLKGAVCADGQCKPFVKDVAVR
jgi:hypothetical protein